MNYKHPNDCFTVVYITLNKQKLKIMYMIGYILHITHMSLDIRTHITLHMPLYFFTF